MRRVLASFGLVCAWLCAQGILLDLAQAVAWSRMFAGYAGRMEVTEAIAETFKPANACAMCHAIQKARETEQEHAPARATVSGDDAGKFVLVLVGAEAGLRPPAGFLLTSRSTPHVREWLSEVPTPPPRWAGQPAFAV